MYDGTNFQLIAGGGYAALSEFNRHEWNKVINGNFDIWQTGRIASTTTGSNILPDRWQYINDGTASNAVTFSQGTFALGQTAVPNNPKYYLNWVFTSVNTPNNYIRQRVEGVQTMSGQQITISAWLKCNSGTYSAAFAYQQEFGTGGSPSSGYYPAAGSTFTVTTAWQRFSTTFNVASISGKTIGTNNNDAINICIIGPATSGISGTISVAQFQCELGPVATSFDLRPISVELARCQRNYTVLGSTGSVTTWAGQVDSSSQQSISLGQLPVTMRGTPSISTTGCSFYSPSTGQTTFTITTNRCSTTTGAFWAASSGSPTAGQACVIYIPGAAGTGYITLDAQI
jgi:hypothetical protein